MARIPSLQESIKQQTFQNNFCLDAAGSKDSQGMSLPPGEGGQDCCLLVQGDGDQAPREKSGLQSVEGREEEPSCISPHVQSRWSFEVRRLGRWHHPPFREETSSVLLFQASVCHRHESVPRHLQAMWCEQEGFQDLPP